MREQKLSAQIRCDFKLDVFPKTLQSLWEDQSSKNEMNLIVINNKM